MFSQILARATDGRVVCLGGRDGTWLTKNGQCVCPTPLIAAEPCEHMIWTRRGIEGKGSQNPYDPPGFMWEHDVVWSEQEMEANWQISLDEALAETGGLQEKALLTWVISHPQMDLPRARSLAERSLSLARPLLRRVEFVQDEVIRRTIKDGIGKNQGMTTWGWRQLIGGGTRAQQQEDLTWVVGLEENNRDGLLMFYAHLLNNKTLGGEKLMVDAQTLKSLLVHEDRLVRAWAIMNVGRA